MRVLLTGASSFLGRHLAAHLVRRGIAVVGTFRTSGLATEQLASLGSRLELVPVDLADDAAFARLPSEIDAVVHIAGMSNNPGGSVDDMLACNVDGARNVLGYALRAGARRLLYASTLSVHGQIADPVVDATTPSCAPDVYGASKLLAERMFAAESQRLPCVAVRLPGVLGKGAHRAWLPTLLESLRAGRPVTIYNPHQLFNNAAHVDDLGGLFHTALHAEATGLCAFPVGAEGYVSIRHLIDRLHVLTRSRSVVTVGEERKPSFTISSEFAKTQFGYRPKHIEQMIEQYWAETAEPG